MEIFSALAREAVCEFGIQEERFHFDTTSVRKSMGITGSMQRALLG